MDGDSRDSERLKVVVYKYGAEDFQRMLSEHHPDVQVHIYPEGTEAGDLEEAQVLIGWRFSSDLLERLSNLKWIQLISVGAEEIARSPSIKSGVVLTNARGIYSDCVAEYVLWAMVSLSRSFHEVLWNQRKKRWIEVRGSSLNGKTLGIIGLGSIGKAIAVRAKGFGLRIIGIKRHISSNLALEGVDELYQPDALMDVLGRSDVIVLCLPLTDETRGILNKEAFGSIKPGAILINIARLGLVDETALVQALCEGRLSGAALDVFDREPLSRWSQLWGLKNLIITPHLSGLTRDYEQRVGSLICENIRRFKLQQPLLNVVERMRGY